MVSIGDSESFRSWLMKKLQPVCDADPTALAKYVMALLKKDKSENELKNLCLEQLDVFLKKETEPFVEDLFEAIRCKSYLRNSESQTVIATLEKTNEKAKETKSSKVISSRSRSPRSRDARHRSPADQRRRAAEEYRSRRRSPDTRRYYNRRRSRSVSPRRRARFSTSPHRRKHRNSSPNRRSPHRKRSRSLSSESIRKNQDSNGKKIERCSDYDGKGFCMKGDHCPYDHGTDAISVGNEDLDDVVSSALNQPDFDETENSNRIVSLNSENTNSIAKTLRPNPQMSSSLHPSVMSLPPPSLVTGHPAGIGLPPDHIMRNFPPPAAINVNIPPPNILHSINKHISLSVPPPPYNPELPSLNKNDRSIANLPLNMTELNLRKRIINENVNQQSDAPQIKRTFFNSGYNAKRTLYIINIPLHLNNITKLNEHFSRFGAINNIQVKYDLKPDQAIVEFAHHNSARAAHHDTNAVLNNRFIKVFWYDPEKSSSYNNRNSEFKASVKDRIGVIPKPKDLKYIASEVENIPKTQPPSATADTENKPAAPVVEEDTKEVMKRRLVELQKQNQATMKEIEAQKALNEKNMEMKKRQEALQKQSRNLLIQQLKAQRAITEKLKMIPDISEEERTQLQNKLSVLEASISQTRKICDSRSKVDHVKRSLQTRKDLLDSELDLYNAESANDSSENYQNLKLKVDRLKAKYKNTSANKHRGGFSRPTRGRGRNPGRGRGSNSYRFYQSGANIDRRTCRIKVSNFTADEKDEILEHFKQFGETEDAIFTNNDTAVSMKYSSRCWAEQALAHGKEFKKRTLTIIWVHENKPIPQPTTISAPDTSSNLQKTSSESHSPKSDSNGSLQSINETESSKLLKSQEDEMYNISPTQSTTEDDFIYDNIMDEEVLLTEEDALDLL